MKCPSCSSEQGFFRYEFGARTCRQCSASIFVQSSWWKWVGLAALVAGVPSWRAVSGKPAPHFLWGVLAYVVITLVADRLTGRMVLKNPPIGASVQKNESDA